MMQIERGKVYPLGSHCDQLGVNFAVYSSVAERVVLCVFDNQHILQAQFDLPDCQHGVWYGYLRGGQAGLVYGYRVYPKPLAQVRHRCNPNKLILDPYARQVLGEVVDDPRMQWFDGADNATIAPKAVVVAADCFDWGDDQRPAIEWCKTILYEAQVKGLTQLHPQIPQTQQGTYAALAHPALIAHWQHLGVTTLELLPIAQSTTEPRLQRLGLRNYWGYNLLAPFALEPRFGTVSALQQAIKQLHTAGIEVIIDVVFNHTAELDDQGPSFGFRLLDDAAYYWHNQQGEYHNFSGCGNALNLTHPRGLAWAMDALRYWATTFHVDGFRFDLATILGRTPEFDHCAAFFAAIAQDPILAPLKLIAEPWDIHTYQLGRFPVGFAQWNDQYRDTVRRFWLTQKAGRGQLADVLAGSSALFMPAQQAPYHSINFITAHDGFTLADLTRYNDKHNQANGEQNRDGHTHNESANQGIEGITEQATINQQRLAVQKALLATLLLSHGTPMLLAGDELGHSQQGNNNAYCQDNQLTWLDWQQPHATLLSEWIAQLITARAAIPILHTSRWWQSDQVQWCAPNGEALEYDDWSQHAAFFVVWQSEFILLINPQNESVSFNLPLMPWQIIVGSVALQEVGCYTLAACSVGLLKR